MSTFQQADSKKTIDEYEWGSGKTLHVQFLFVCLFVCLLACFLACLFSLLYLLDSYNTKSPQPLC